jgi:hypothetical protein
MTILALFKSEAEVKIVLGDYFLSKLYDQYFQTFGKRG